MDTSSVYILFAFLNSNNNFSENSSEFDSRIISNHSYDQVLQPKIIYKPPKLIYKIQLFIMLSTSIIEKSKHKLIIKIRESENDSRMLPIKCY